MERTAYLVISIMERNVWLVISIISHILFGIIKRVCHLNPVVWPAKLNPPKTFWAEIAGKVTINIYLLDVVSLGLCGWKGVNVGLHSLRCAPATCPSLQQVAIAPAPFCYQSHSAHLMI